MSKTKQHKSFHADNHLPFDEEEQKMRARQYRKAIKQATEVDLEELQTDDPNYHMYEKYIR